MDYNQEIIKILNKIAKEKEQLDKDEETLRDLLSKESEYKKNMMMKDKIFLIFHQDDKIALCYVKDIVDDIFVDCNSIFCSDNEITLSFNDRFHIGSLKEVRETDQETIKNILNSHLKTFQSIIDIFCDSNNYYKNKQSYDKEEIQ